MSLARVDAADVDAVSDVLGEAESVLLVASDDFEARATCQELVSRAADGPSQLLGVTLDRTPDTWLDHLRAHLGELPAETGIIAVGETTRSAATATVSGPEPGRVTAETVSDPSDLTGLAMAIGTYLDAWSAADGSAVVCFDSITSLLFHADVERVFRFLHATTGRLRASGAVAHYHLNPDAFDEATVNTFSALFDAVVRVEDDGTVSVTTRR